jgi:preprotein translocase subunit SecD
MELTCTGHREALPDCVGAAADAPRIVLLGPAREKYVLGPRIVDASDVVDAAAQADASPSSGWSVSARLTAHGTAALATATESNVGSRIAIVVDGRIVSAPTVAVPISSGNVVVASGLTEGEATSLASRLDPG